MQVFVGAKRTARWLGLKELILQLLDFLAFSLIGHIFYKGYMQGGYNN
jgi:hypothetical protein